MNCWTCSFLCWVQGYYTSQLEHARSLGLSDKQAALYAQSSLSVLAGLENELPVIGTAVRQTVTALGLSPDPGPARQAVLDELQGDPAASHVATLIERAGRTFNDTDLRAIGQFDRARSGHTEFWDRAPQPATNGRPLAGVIPNQPAPPHLAAYEAAANRLMGRMVIVESSGQHINPDGSLLTNPKSGAQGITQLLPATAQNPGYGVTPVRNHSREEYLRFGRDYLAAMLQEFDGDPRKALAAYNWGPGNVENAVQQHGVKWEVALQQETRDSVRPAPWRRCEHGWNGPRQRKPGSTSGKSTNGWRCMAAIRWRSPVGTLALRTLTKAAY